MSTTRSGGSRRPLLVLLATAVVVVVAGGLWYLFLRPAGPAPVALGSNPPPTPTLAPPSPEDGGTALPSGSADVGSPASPTTDDTGIEGTWAVDATVGSFDDFSSSFVGYRVREELASIGATEAVGRTPDVTGELTVDGTLVTGASFEADLTTLRSDEANRDRQLSRQALETAKFPTATFTLTRSIELGDVQEGVAVDLTAIGDLTLHGVTQTVEVPMQAKLDGGVVTVVGSLPIAFADYDIEKPSSFVVLSVEDNGTLEFQLHFTRA